ncbi:hypothetical protein [Microbacterium trichothecenolyticum]|uniref:Uncharacterized protein n=1 Tax=Microbacterium trichothecenolyticum TaxID=69370 RepID=A0ABU0TVY0_MICTR|nr:hypothetical protein [Microbacterium trichothecenolyticum]MDQ1123820.1 hypothetical protein [Microbacterium trichothecenolyticum]
MTLTALLPTLRSSIPAPFDAAAWPAGAAPTLDDVTVRAMSIDRYADLCGTPCVCTGPAVIPASGGVASANSSTTVVVTTVTNATCATVQLDAGVAGLDVTWSEARLIGRISHAYVKPYAVIDAHGSGACGTAVLPSDLHPGDRLAFPCPGNHTLGDVR